MLQIGAIYLWSYVYNIVRVSSVRSGREVEICETPPGISPTERIWTKPLLDSDGHVIVGDPEDGTPVSQDSPNNSEVRTCVLYI